MNGSINWSNETNNYNNFTSTGSLLSTDSVVSRYRYVPSHKGHMYLFQKRDPVHYWAVKLSDTRRNILRKGGQPKPVTA